MSNTISQTTWQPASRKYENGKWTGIGVYLWYGYERATQEDIDALYSYCKGSPDPGPYIEEFTVQGRLQPLWRSANNPITEDPSPGGINSRLYEHQFIDEIGASPANVEFTDTAIWYKDADGQDIHGIPPNSGAYHSAPVGDDYYDTFAGPRPDSPASEILGDGAYVWDDKALLWRVNK